MVRKSIAAQLARTGEIVSLQRPIVLSKRHEEIARDGKPNGLPFYEMTFRTFPKDDPRGILIDMRRVAETGEPRRTRRTQR